jgi:glycosyltransferase involved in cell wall biosynthesis
MEYRISLDARETFDVRGDELKHASEASLKARVAVVCDFREENWHSMNLVADALVGCLQSDYAGQLSTARVCPPMRRLFTRKATVAGRRFNADRLLNRFWYYPRHLRRNLGGFDLFHVVDHSYAQLVHQLPPERTVVTCHDLDTFRCLLDPNAEPRSRPFRLMTKRVLDGMGKAARITCDSAFTRDELLSFGLLSSERVVVVHNGVAPIYSPTPDTTADAEAERLLGPLTEESLDILHVGSTAPRKRIDILLRVFDRVRQEFPQARLVRAGGAFNESQLRLIESLRLGDWIVALPFIDERVLAAIYRRAALLLQPSEREGFGMPVAEALACGTPVLASDLPVLREVGGEAATYRAVADIPAWKEAAVSLLAERLCEHDRWAERQAKGISHAGKFNWSEYARQMVSIYQSLL